MRSRQLPYLDNFSWEVHKSFVWVLFCLRYTEKFFCFAGVCNRRSLCSPAASVCTVDPTSQLSSYSILVLPVVGNRKLLFFGSPHSHNFRTKCRLSSLFWSSIMLTDRQKEGRTGGRISDTWRRSVRSFHAHRSVSRILTTVLLQYCGMLLYYIILY
jgi:hypothetical protein